MIVAKGLIYYNNFFRKRTKVMIVDILPNNGANEAMVLCEDVEKGTLQELNYKYLSKLNEGEDKVFRRDPSKQAGLLSESILRIGRKVEVIEDLLPNIKVIK